MLLGVWAPFMSDQLDLQSLPAFLAGYTNITNVDFSRVVIDQMSETYSAYGMKCKQV